MLWVYYLAASASDRDTLHPRPEMPYHGRVVGHGHTCESWATANGTTVGHQSDWNKIGRHELTRSTSTRHV